MCLQKLKSPPKPPFFARPTCESQWPLIPNTKCRFADRHDLISIFHSLTVCSKDRECIKTFIKNIHVTLIQKQNLMVQL